MEKNITILKNLEILFVEDDTLMLEHTKKTLDIFFKEVYTCETINSAKEIYYERRPDIILCDIKLEDENGLDFVKYVREKDYKTPIIMLTSHNDSSYILQAANLGIDGYILKPLSLDKILEVFLKAIERIPYLNSTINISNSLKYSFFDKQLYYNDTLVELGEKENKLFEFFVKNVNKTLSKEEIIYYIWPLEEVTESAFKNLLSRLRAKLVDDIIHTVKNKGWVIKVD